VRLEAGDEPPRLERTGIVFQRPLPYLYLARQVLGSANVRYQASDALPLAAEPFAAALDLVFAVAAEDASRAALIALLVMAVAAAEATVGLAIVIAIYRNRRTPLVDEYSSMRE